jgi:hypothetical protein
VAKDGVNLNLFRINNGDGAHTHVGVLSADQSAAGACVAAKLPVLLRGTDDGCAAPACATRANRTCHMPGSCSIS